jgi:uncharacterized UBP type Zn finger protein
MNDITCAHQNQIKPDVIPTTTEGCEDCLKIGGRWVEVRMCLTCGHTGCCNSSINRHAQAHHNETGHPIIQSSPMKNDWRWCYIDNNYV